MWNASRAMRRIYRATATAQLLAPRALMAIVQPATGRTHRRTDRCAGKRPPRCQLANYRPTHSTDPGTAV